MDALLDGGRAAVSHIVGGTIGKTVRSVAAAVAAPTAVGVITIAAAIAHWNVVVLALLILLGDKAHHVTAVHRGVYGASVSDHLPAAIR